MASTMGAARSAETAVPSRCAIRPAAALVDPWVAAAESAGLLNQVRVASSRLGAPASSMRSSCASNPAGSRTPSSDGWRRRAAHGWRQRAPARLRSSLVASCSPGPARSAAPGGRRSTRPPRAAPGRRRCSARRIVPFGVANRPSAGPSSHSCSSRVGGQPAAPQRARRRQPEHEVADPLPRLGERTDVSERVLDQFVLQPNARAPDPTPATPRWRGSPLSVAAPGGRSGASARHASPYRGSPTMGRPTSSVAGVRRPARSLAIAAGRGASAAPTGASAPRTSRSGALGTRG